MIVQAVRDILLLDTGVAAMFGDRIYPVQLPDAPTYPAAVITKVSGRGEYDNGGDVGLEEARVQLDVYAEGYALAVEAKTLCRRVLSGFKGGVPGNSCQIDAAFVISDTDLSEPATERSGPRLRRRMVEFRIWNREI